jgi:hypothetical protein
MKSETTKLHASHIELAVANLLNPRIYVIVPNVSYGLFLNHECDLLALDSQGRFTEIEIKISASDLKADFKKKHGHKSNIISRLIYAMPYDLCKKYEDLIPLNCGIISITTEWHPFSNNNDVVIVKANHYRQVKHDKTKEKPSEKIKMLFMRLGCMRIWSLKAHNNKRLVQIKN